jgi:hypothetical protein
MDVHDYSENIQMDHWKWNKRSKYRILSKNIFQNGVEDSLLENRAFSDQSCKYAYAILNLIRRNPSFILENYFAIVFHLFSLALSAYGIFLLLLWKHKINSSEMVKNFFNKYLNYIALFKIWYKWVKVMEVEDRGE